MKMMTISEVSKKFYISARMLRYYEKEGIEKPVRSDGPVSIGQLIEALYHGKFYDPEFGLLEECHPEGRITSFLEIYL